MTTWLLSALLIVAGAMAIIAIIVTLSILGSAAGFLGELFKDEQ